MMPPAIDVAVSWRSLWRSGSFAQRRLMGLGRFASDAGKRDLRLGIGSKALEALDVRGAFRPIALTVGPVRADVVDLGPFEQYMVFREEQETRAWSEYAPDPENHIYAAPHYSPWQLLYLDDVLGGTTFDLDLDILLSEPERRDRVLGQLFSEFKAQRQRWLALETGWLPIVKLLVRIQNRYWPPVSGTTTMLYDGPSRLDPWAVEREAFDATIVAKQLGVTSQQLKDTYEFLVERGLKHDSPDGLTLLRRAQPRSVHERRRGDVLIARDHFDAAQLVRDFLTDLQGAAPALPSLLPADQRQREREALYDQGPASITTREDAQTELGEIGVYPHAVHLIGEGKSEEIMVKQIVAGFVGRTVAAEIGFTDLGGVGIADRLATMVDGFTRYAQRTLIIVDTEGKMAQNVDGLIKSKRIPAEDVLRFQDNVEESNFSVDELVETIIDLAARPSPPHPPVTLTLTADDLERAYTSRRRRTDNPGRAGVLLGLAEDPALGGPFRISKPEFARALAERCLKDYADVADNPAAVARLFERRPLLRFTVERILPVLVGRRWR